MKRNNRLDYRGYEVEPPNTYANRRGEWFGQALLRGMPNVTGPSEGELRRAIDYAHDSCAPDRLNKE